MAVAAGMFRVAATAGAVPCYLCGAAVALNLAGICVACLRGQVDITDGLPKACTVLFCRQSWRYLQPPRAWLPADLESKELLAFCLKRVKNLNKLTFPSHNCPGNLLSPGYHVVGYDPYGANLSDAELEKHKALVLPDVVLVKKSYEEKRRRRQVPLEELLLDLRIGDNDEHGDGGADSSNGSSEHDDMES
eukprot:SM000004S15130  [mRNA]  locus=s4:1422815:1423838:+ [translate_table: standard]